MTQRHLFTQITLRTAAGILAAAWLAQACFMMFFVAFGLFAAAVNGGLSSPAEGAQATLALFFLALVGGVAGGFFALPAGVVVGVTGGALAGLLTRLFFFPLANPARYRTVLTVFLAIYTTVAAWLVFMALYLLLAADHVVHDPAVIWIALAAAAIAGLCAGVVGWWVSRWYVAQQAGRSH